MGGWGRAVQADAAPSSRSATRCLKASNPRGLEPKPLSQVCVFALCRVAQQVRPGHGPFGSSIDILPDASYRVDRNKMSNFALYSIQDAMDDLRSRGDGGHGDVLVF